MPRIKDRILKYDFTNKIGKFLGLEISTIKGKAAAPLAAVPAVVGGDLSGWKFSPVFKNGVEKSVLYSYFTNDSVIGLKVNTSGDVEMVKTIATTAGITAAGFTEFELVEAASIVVSGADEFNTIFGTQAEESWYHIEVYSGCIRRWSGKLLYREEVHG